MTWKKGWLLGLLLIIAAVAIWKMTPASRDPSGKPEKSATRSNGSGSSDGVYDTVQKHVTVRKPFLTPESQRSFTAGSPPVFTDDGFMQDLDFTIKLKAGLERRKRLVDLLTRVGQSRDGELLKIMLPLLLASGTPEEAWLSLKALYGSIPPEALGPVDQVMQGMSVGAYYTFMVENVAAGRNSDAHQIHTVDQLYRLAVENSYPRQPILSSLGYTALASSSTPTRERTLTVLSEIGDRTTVPALQEHMARETDETLRTRTSGLIETLGQR